MDIGVNGYRINMFVYHEDIDKATKAGEKLAKLICEIWNCNYHVVYPIEDDLLAYRREKILLWNDFNYERFCTVLGSDVNIRDAICIYPEHKYQTRFNAKGIKYMLSNDANIFTSSRPFEQFIDEVYNKTGYYVVHNYNNLYETRKDAIAEVRKNIPFSIAFKGDAMKVYIDHTFLENEDISQPLCIMLARNPFLSDNVEEALEKELLKAIEQTKTFAKLELLKQ